MTLLNLELETGARFVSRLTRETLALILAGGRGSRLHQLTQWRAKPAVPFGGKYRVIDFPLSNCINSGVRRISVLTQYKSHSLIQHIQRGWSFLRGEFGEFIEVWPAQQRLDEAWWYRGTADAVYQNLDIIRAHQPEYVLILAGDHIYKMDYGPLLAYHAERQADVTVGCIEMPRSSAHQFGVMSVDASSRVVEFLEKPADPPSLPSREDASLVSMGIYVFNAQYLYRQLDEDAQNLRSQHDFGGDLLPAAIAQDRVFAYPFQNAQTGYNHYWRDVGTVDAFWEANMDLVSINPELNLYDQNWPIWTHEDQVPPAKFVFDSDDRRGMAVDSLVCGGCVISGGYVHRSLLFSNVRVNSYAALDQVVALPQVDIGRHCWLRKVIVDEGCQLPPGTVIGEDPILDAQRFHRTPQGVVLVTAEMVEELEKPPIRRFWFTDKMAKSEPIDE